MIRNGWVGRNIAESKTSKFCYVITATYGRGMVGESLHERAVVLTYSDCQKFLKLLRRHGYAVRYFITGEYGTERQRAHWNIILYSEKPLPALTGWDQFGGYLPQARLEQRFNWVRSDDKGQPVYLQDGKPAWWWPHGFVYVDELNVRSVNYVSKYALKDFDQNGKQGHKGQSKTPPLGARYFEGLAEKYVDQGIAPQTPEYTFPECRTKDGEVIRFWLTGRSLELFLQHFLRIWEERFPDRARPVSKLVDLFEQYGKVVNDEMAMLVRTQFERGESKEAWPSKADWAYAKERRAYENDLENHRFVWSEQNSHQWIEAAKNEQERQERQRQAERQFEREFIAFQHKHNRHQYPDGWDFESQRTGPCTCCHSGGSQSGDAVG